jgi:hypothetical protein
MLPCFGKQKEKQMARSLNIIARDILIDWQRPNYAAAPYIDAMVQLKAVTDKYGADDASTIILYFLSNAAGWRGEVARRVKAELKAML